MGYTTDFDGSFKLDKPLKPEHIAYLAKFNDTRRVKRNAEIAATMPDPVRIAAGLPIGIEGGYYVGSERLHGQERDASVVEYNDPPEGQPGLWCQWVPSEDGSEIEWDQGEKFYEYTPWLEYIIEHFLKPWGYVLSGEVEYQGEDTPDHGKIFAKDNKVAQVEAKAFIVNPFE